MSFIPYSLPAPILSALKKLNYQSPTKIQEATLQLALAGRDLIASAQTGSGKTAAFAIPLITKLIADKNAHGLILAPTRELAVQIAKVIEDLTTALQGMRPAILIGGVPLYKQERALSRNPRIIVATPGRLVDHLRAHPRLLKAVKVLVLDEADRMLDMGFAPQLKEVREALSGEHQTLLFSATYPTDIQHLAREWMTNPERIKIDSVGLPAEKINQEVRKIDEGAKKTTVINEIGTREGSMLIFTRTKIRADKLARSLVDEGIPASQIHGGRSQAQRQRTLEGFRRGSFRVLVATDIAARGLDIPHIEHVINYDLPFVAEDYLHRIGRTGRAGKSGNALCLIAPHERHLWRSIERLMAEKEGRSSAEQAKEAAAFKKRGSEAVKKRGSEKRSRSRPQRDPRKSSGKRRARFEGRRSHASF